MEKKHSSTGTQSKTFIYTSFYFRFILYEQHCSDAFIMDNNDSMDKSSPSFPKETREKINERYGIYKSYAKSEKKPISQGEKKRA